MNFSEFETEEVRPVKAWCADDRVHVELKDGRTVSAPLWWYPFLEGSTDEQLNEMDLTFEGVWWEHVDEGVSVKGLLLGRKAPGAKQPQEAA